MKKLVETQNDWLLTLTRLTLALAIFPHGAQKVLGWFGGYGYEATMGAMSKMLPPAVVMLVMAAEFLGGIALALGLFGRVASAGTIAVMIGAILMVHLPNGFFINWMGSQKGEGIEYHLVFIGLAIITLVRGSGAFSLDRVIANRLEAARATWSVSGKSAPAL